MIEDFFFTIQIYKLKKEDCDTEGIFSHMITATTRATGMHLPSKSDLVVNPTEYLPLHPKQHYDGTIFPGHGTATACAYRQALQTK